jgi:hypothetical protein
MMIGSVEVGKHCQLILDSSMEGANFVKCIVIGIINYRSSAKFCRTKFVTLVFCFQILTLTTFEFLSVF